MSGYSAQFKFFSVILRHKKWDKIREMENMQNLDLNTQTGHRLNELVRHPFNFIKKINGLENFWHPHSQLFVLLASDILKKYSNELIKFWPLFFTVFSLNSLLLTHAASCTFTSLLQSIYSLSICLTVMS